MQRFFHKYSLLGAVCLAAALTSCRTIFERGEEGVAAVRYLRQLIRQYLRTVPSVSDARDEHVQFGGAGITVVDLE